MQKLATPVKKIRLLLVDDHMAIRVGLMTAANDTADMDVIANVDNGPDALAAFRKSRPDVVVLDLRLPGMSGIEILKALLEESRQVRVLVFSNYATGEAIYQAMTAGAYGFVLKEMPLDKLLEGIRTVYRGEQYIPPEIAMRMGKRLLTHLSPREIEVLHLLSRGLSNKEIGAQLGVVEGTVKIHIGNIFTKLGVADRTQALIEAVKRGFVQID